MPVLKSIGGDPIYLAPIPAVATAGSFRSVSGLENEKPVPPSLFCTIISAHHCAI